ncbi:unnamed protein product, partial [Didymodactylos carnosus]
EDTESSNNGENTSNGINDQEVAKEVIDDDDEENLEDSKAEELLDERMTIENAHIEEKAAAIEALGNLVENCTIGSSTCRSYSDLCVIINSSTSRSLAEVALDAIKTVLEEVKMDMLKHVPLLEKIAHCTQKVLSYKTKCQQENDDENDDGGDAREQDGQDDAEYDVMLILTGDDLLPVLTSIACTEKVAFFPAYLASIILKLQKRLACGHWILKRWKDLSDMFL